MRELRATGELDNLEVSEEVNAASIVVPDEGFPGLVVRDVRTGIRVEDGRVLGVETSRGPIAENMSVKPECPSTFAASGGSSRNVLSACQFSPTTRPVSCARRRMICTSG